MSPFRLIVHQRYEQTTNNNNSALTREYETMSVDRTINIIGVFGVIVSLIFLGYEAREANKLARVETEFQLMNNYAAWNEGVIECPECYTASFDEDMPQSEYWRNLSLVYRALNTWQASEVAYDNGLVSERTFNIFYRDAELLIEEAKAVGTIELWKEALNGQSGWSDSIVFQYLYKIIAE